MLGLQFPAVMGILNVTPDSFSDGGRYFNRADALVQARRMIAEGAQVIDVGGESTRPGANRISVQEELDRVIPVIEGICAVSDVSVSVDTSTPEVMRAAAAAGAKFINDVRALRRAGAVAAAAETGLSVCLMHMQGEPGTMQQDPRYDDLIGEISGFFYERLEHCERNGIPREKVLLDPGFGFGKTATHNLILINRLEAFLSLGRPLLVGLSRKSTIAKVLGDAAADRLHASVAGALFAVLKGAAVVRVHDVGPTVEALRMIAAIKNESAT